jgi:hypothetical protein
MLIYATTAIAFFCFFFSVPPLFCIGMALMGFTYGPLGTFLSTTNIRYSSGTLWLEFYALAYDL